MTRIVHLSDFHFDGSPELRRALRSLVDAAIARDPDLANVTAATSADGRPDQLDEVADELSRFGAVPRVVIPGNHAICKAVDGAARRGAPAAGRSDSDYFLALEPALTLGFEDGVPGDPEAIWTSRFGGLAPMYRGPDVHVVGVTTTPRLRSEALSKSLLATDCKP